MKKNAVISLWVAVIVLVAAGCATTPADKGLTDEEQITKQIQDGIEAIKAKDYSLFEKSVSESFYAGVIGDKEDLLAYLKNADDMGFLDGIEIDLSESVITVEGNKASISAITAQGVFGYQGLAFEGAKEDDGWVITGLSPY